MMTGIMVSGIGIGSLVGPITANYLISVFEWRLSFIILGIIALVVVILAAQFMKRDPASNGQIAFGGESIKEKESKSEEVSFSLKESIVTRQFWVFFFALLCFGFFLFTVQVHLVPYATDLGISSDNASKILATIGATSIIGGMVISGIGDRIGNKKAFILGLVVMSLDLIWLLTTRETWGLYLFAAVFGLAYGHCATQESPLAAKLFGLASHGLIFGVVGIGFTTGSALGPYLAGWIFDLAGSYQVSFIVNIVICFVGIILMLLLAPMKKR